MKLTLGRIYENPMNQLDVNWSAVPSLKMVGFVIREPNWSSLGQFMGLIRAQLREEAGR